MTFIYIIIFFFLLIIFIVLGVIGSIARFLFGKPRVNSSAQQQHQQQQKKTSNKWYTYGKKRNKVFTENDGEYVDFEEIKPDKK